MNNDPLLINKLVGALLTAGLIAMASGFVAHLSYHPHELEKPAYSIGGAAPAATEVATKAPEIEPIAPLLAAADPKKGEQIAKKCHACHNFVKGGSNKVGPDLYGVVGGPRAHNPTFNYSSAMKEKGGTWTIQDLNHFLFKPRAFIPGTKMTFAGLPKAQDRADVIRFLRDKSDSPIPLPTK